MFSDDCEMAYGEQAALVGLCELIRPKVAIEIGTYRGGSLALLASHAERVHTFDLVSHVTSELPNVSYHLGDSSETVPSVLATLERVDLALVDGDHSRSGVRRDLEALLDSDAVRETVIVCHDIANEGVRAGVRDAIRRADLAYVNLSFVPPYEHVGPLSEAWGGLGLIVVDRTGSLWPHRRRTDANTTWPTAIRQGFLWSAARPMRTAMRIATYRARPLIRRRKGIRGVKQR